MDRVAQLCVPPPFWVELTGPHGILPRGRVPALHGLSTGDLDVCLIRNRWRRRHRIRAQGKHVRIVSINIGQPAVIVRGGRQYTSSINRRPVEGSVGLTRSGLIGDQVSDGLVHGGADQAVCCYPHEHYPYWEAKLETPLVVPSFGENLTTDGLFEDQICIGDALRIGQAVVEVSQPRLPCWKLADKHSEPELVRWINETGYSGFYVRVLDPGHIGVASELSLLDRPHEGLTVQQVLQAAVGPAPQREMLERLASAAALSAVWRARMAKKLAALEDPSSRD